MTHPIILITRPVHQAKDLCALIESLQGHCIIFPTLLIETYSTTQITQAIANLPAIEKVIFTSSNAVYPVMPCWENINPTTGVFAIGSGTAKALAHFKIHAQIPTEFNSESLLTLADLQRVKDQRIVIFSGVGGRDLLEKVLKSRGAQVEKIAVYKRQCPVLTEKFPPVPNVSMIVCTSEESLRNLWQMAGVAGQLWLKQQRLLVISTKMQQLAQQLGFSHVPVVAKNASDTAILESLRHTVFS